MAFLESLMKSFGFRSEKMLQSSSVQGRTKPSNTVHKPSNTVQKPIAPKVIDVADNLSAKIQADLLSYEVVKSKDEITIGNSVVRGSLSSQFGIQGNNLSYLAVVDYGQMQCGLLVSKSNAGGKALRNYIDVREKIQARNLKIVLERRSEVSLIAEINNAVNNDVDEKKSSDAQPLCDEIVHSAINDNATDIHICCRYEYGSGMVLNRIHGRMHKYRKYDVATCKQIIGVLYNNSEASSRKPNTFTDTHREMSCVIALNYKGQFYKLRYQFCQAADGWDVIIRILHVSDNKQLTFLQLGYAPSHVRLIEPSVKRSIGLVAITGPTGSGKSTTLKTMMMFDPNRLDKKRYSLEDPVEYKIFGVSQITVQDGKYAEALRVLLRADPDEIMVGETRDSSTTGVVADAVMTGHKLYTTLHTHSAIGAYSRLSRLGLDRFILADRQFVAVLVFQRLMPVLCKECKICVEGSNILSEEQKSMLKLKFKLNLSNIFCSNNTGCACCRSGIVGSTVVAEVVRPDAGLRQFILEQNDNGAEDYWRRTRTAKFDNEDMTGKTAFEHAMYKVSQGLIDPRDVENEFEPFETYEIIPVDADQY